MSNLRVHNRMREDSGEHTLFPKMADRMLTGSYKRERVTVREGTRRPTASKGARTVREGSETLDVLVEEGLKEDVKEVESRFDAREATVDHESSYQSLHHVSDFLEREEERKGADFSGSLRV